MKEFGSQLKDPRPETRKRIPPSSSSPSSIPFSWEQQPGIPKNLARNNNPMKAHQPGGRPLLIPLPPPPLKPAPVISSRKKRPERSRVDPDPFALALAECTKIRTRGPPEVRGADAADVAENREPRRRRRRENNRRSGAVGPTTWGVGDRFGRWLDLLGSCKHAAACSVSKSAVRVSRSGC